VTSLQRELAIYLDYKWNAVELGRARVRLIIQPACWLEGSLQPSLSPLIQ
jgi:hypothetical protein